jgi:hypothetical protein
MSYSPVLLALLCLQGAEAANVLRGRAAAEPTMSPHTALEAADFIPDPTLGLLGNPATQDAAEPAMDIAAADAKKAVKKVYQIPMPMMMMLPSVGNGGWLDRILLQLLFGLLYYYLIVSKYPMLDSVKPTTEAIKLQELDELTATFETSIPNCLLSWCCTGPRAAHTFHSAGVLNFWPGCILMSLFPCCMLWWANSCTDIKEMLGGAKKNFCLGCLSACFCSCCVVAQDAQSLDLITGSETHLCSVETH